VESLKRYLHAGAMRYLCVGAEVDWTFARRVIEELLVERHRAVAPSYGMDVRPVIRHCLRAQRRRSIRDLALALLVVGELIVAPLPAVAAIATVYWVRESRRQPSRSNEQTFAWMVALAAVGLATWLQFGHGVPSALPGLLGLTRIEPFLLSLPAVLLAAAALVYGEWHMSRRVVRRYLDSEAFDPAEPVLRLSGWVEDRLEEIELEQRSCITVCNMSEDSPFVGAGIAGRRLMVTVDVSRPDRTAAAERREPRPFVPMDVHRHLEVRLRGLRSESVSQALRLPLEISDRVLIDGRVLRGHRPTRKEVLSRARPDELADIANVPAGESRHHLCLRVEPVDGEQVITVFVHVSTQGQTLYIEFTPCVQLPINRTYRMVDARPFPTVRQRLQAIGASCTTCVPMLLGAPRRLLRWQLRLAAGWRGQHIRRQADLQSWMDYGARTSVRDLGSAASLDHFQELDVRKYVHVILQQALNAVADFLVGHEVDTSGLRTQEAMIYQLIISGDYNIVGDNNTSVSGSAPPADRQPPIGRPTPGGTPAPGMPPRAAPPPRPAPPGAVPSPGGAPTP